MNRTMLVAPLLLAIVALPVRVTGQADASGPECWVRGERADLELRASPFDSAVARVPAGTVKVCYSRPRKLGRPIMGRLVRFGQPWRFGADEATTIHMPGSGSVAGVPVEAGSYSLYVVPEEREWRIVVNEALRRWGIPIDEDVRAADVGSGIVPVESTDRVVEMMTVRLERRSDTAVDMVVEWDRTRVRIPVTLDADREVTYRFRPLSSPSPAAPARGRSPGRCG